MYCSLIRILFHFCYSITVRNYQTIFVFIVGLKGLQCKEHIKTTICALHPTVREGLHVACGCDCGLSPMDDVSFLKLVRLLKCKTSFQWSVHIFGGTM